MHGVGGLVTLEARELLPEEQSQWNNKKTGHDPIVTAESHTIKIKITS